VIADVAELWREAELKLGEASATIPSRKPPIPRRWRQRTTSAVPTSRATDSGRLMSTSAVGRSS